MVEVYASQQSLVCLLFPTEDQTQSVFAFPQIVQQQHPTEIWDSSTQNVQNSGTCPKLPPPLNEFGTQMLVAPVVLTQWVPNCVCGGGTFI